MYNCHISRICKICPWGTLHAGKIQNQDQCVPIGCVTKVIKTQSQEQQRNDATKIMREGPDSSTAGPYKHKGDVITMEEVQEGPLDQRSVEQ